jgi:hypothetical protein
MGQSTEHRAQSTEHIDQTEQLGTEQPEPEPEPAPPLGITGCWTLAGDG